LRELFIKGHPFLEVSHILVIGAVYGLICADILFPGFIGEIRIINAVKNELFI
jgi:hypothetical protein